MDEHMPIDSPSPISIPMSQNLEEEPLPPRPVPRWTRLLPLIDVPFLEAFYRADKSTQGLVERLLSTGTSRLPPSDSDPNEDNDSDSDSDSDDEDYEDDWEVWIDPSETEPYSTKPSDELLAEIASTATSYSEWIEMLYNRANPFIKLLVEKTLYKIDPRTLSEPARLRREETEKTMNDLRESYDRMKKKLDELQVLFRERYGDVKYEHTANPMMEPQWPA